ncbi:MAG TPA: serine/threonine-protein kinase, partial [Kofleriaceae bacterium]|nr:serine/threonine-protein kinase [Kofleriaceae bacterium]
MNDDTIRIGTGADETWPVTPDDDDLSRTIRDQATFGRFTILDVLGAGGMGVVLSAYDPQLDRKVAIKVLRTRGLYGERYKREAERLLREARSMAQLSHPHVVTVYEAGEIDGRVFVAMEYISGQTLRSWLAERTRRVGEILDVLVKAGRGLAAGHRAGLIHRDF